MTSYELYRQANIEGNYSLVESLNQQGMKPSVPAPVKPGIISQMMDIATQRATLLEYLQNLRQEGRLLMENEFSQKAQYMTKDKGLERVLGADLIQKKTEELGLKHIKVPKKILVIKKEDPDQQELKIRGFSGEENLYYFDTDSRLSEKNPVKIQFYAQKVTPITRKMTREEIDELFVIIEAANFTDMDAGNIFLCEDGIYFIDTEFKSLSGSINWGKMDRYMTHIDEGDQEYFRSKMNQRISEQKPSFFISSDRLTYGMAKLSYECLLPENRKKERESCLQTMEAFRAVGADQSDPKQREFLLKISKILEVEPQEFSDSCS